MFPNMFYCSLMLSDYALFNLKEDVIQEHMLTVEYIDQNNNHLV